MYYCYKRRAIRSRGGGTDTSSEKQRPTREISTRSHGSGRNSSSARGSQGPPLTRDDIPVLIQEVVQSLMKRSSLVNSPWKIPRISPPQSAIRRLQPPSRTIHRLQITFLDWYSKYVEPTQKTTIPYRASIPRPLDQFPTSELVVTYWGLISNYSAMYTCVVGLIAKHSAMYSY